MNILFLSLSRISDLSQRGIYTDLMRELTGRGHQLYIANPVERRYGQTTHVIQACGASILRIRTLNIQKTNVVEKGIGTLLLEYQFARAIRKYWHQVRFDLVLYATPPITFNRIIAKIKQRDKARTYLMLKDIFPQNAVDLGMLSRRSPLYQLFRRKERRLYALSDRIGCMSPANVAYVLHHNTDISSERVELCPNAVEPIARQTLDPTERAALRKKLGIPPDEVVSLYGGNLGKPQGVDFLIQTIASNEKRTASYMLIVGAGTEFRRLRTWFDEHRPKHAGLFSTLPKAEYDKLLPLADIGLIYLDHRFTIPNYPSRLTAYMEQALPVMMATDENTDIGSIAESEGYGLWTESDNVERFDEKFNQLLCSADLRREMGQRGRQYLLDNYTVKHVADIILTT